MAEDPSGETEGAPTLPKLQSISGERRLPGVAMEGSTKASPTLSEEDEQEDITVVIRRTGKICLQYDIRYIF